MQIARRHWAAAFGTAVLIHAGVALEVLSRAPETDVEHATPAGIRVSLGAAAGTPDSVPVAGTEVAAARTATTREVTAVPSTEAWMPATSEFPVLQPIEAAEIRAIESAGAAFDTAPVEPAEPTPIEEPLPVESAQVPSVEVSPGVELAEVALIEEPSPAKLVDLSPSVEPAEAKVADMTPALESAEAVLSTTSPRIDSAVDAVPAEPTESTPIEEALPVDPASVMPAEAPEIRQVVPVTRVEPPADSVAPDPVALVSRESERFGSAAAPVKKEPSRESRRESRREAGGTRPPSRSQVAARAPSMSEGRSATGPLDSVAGVATSLGSRAPRVQADYLARVQAWIEKHKEYPYRARLRREEGTALLYFVVDRHGRVRDYELRQSTGHALLDREVLAMIERAQPLPRVPSLLNPVTLEMIVPVRFSLR